MTKREHLDWFGYDEPTPPPQLPTAHVVRRKKKRMHRTCTCGRIFEWSRLGEFAKSVMDKILALRGKEPVQILCPTCRHNEQLGLFKERR